MKISEQREENDYYLKEGMVRDEAEYSVLMNGW